MTARGQHTADVTIPCGSEQHAKWVRQAIQAEVDEAPDGAQASLSVDGSTLRAVIQAEDLAGLRASLNTVVRLADAALRTVQTRGGAGSSGRPHP